MHGGLDILLVDDDPGSLSSLEDLLRTDGHRIRCAQRGREAIGIVERLAREDRRLQLSILDVDVPDLSGLETFRVLTTVFPGVGAIFITGDPSERVECEVRAIGGFALVRKPVDVLRLRSLIREYHGGFEDRWF